MHAASRESLAKLRTELDAAVGGAGDSVANAAQTGTELFDVVEVLDSDRGLRVAVADQSVTAEQRSGIIRSLFAGKVSETALKVITDAAAQPGQTRGSSARDWWSWAVVPCCAPPRARAWTRSRRSCSVWAHSVDDTARAAAGR